MRQQAGIAAEEPVVDEIRIRVAALIVEASQLLLVEHTKDGRSYWMPPGGGVDFGETLTGALARELREELGVTIEAEALVAASDAIEPGGNRHIVNLFFTARITEGIPLVGEDERVSGVAFHPLNSLAEIELFPPIASTLQELFAQESIPHARYLGNLWKS